MANTIHNNWLVLLNIIGRMYIEDMLILYESFRVKKIKDIFSNEFTRINNVTYRNKLFNLQMILMVHVIVHVI